MVLDDDFELVHGARHWDAVVHMAKWQGAKIPPAAPAVCASVVWAHRHLPEHVMRGDGTEVIFEYTVASVGAIQTDASMVVFEWLVTNPRWPLAGRHRAVEHLMRAGLVYATAVGKRPVMLNVPRGVRMIAERVGFASGKTFEVLMGEMP